MLEKSFFDTTQKLARAELRLLLHENFGAPTGRLSNPSNGKACLAAA